LENFKGENNLVGDMVDDGILFLKDVPDQKGQVNGRETQLLKSLIQDVHLTSDAAISHVIKCHISDDYNPKIADIRQCREYVDYEISQFTPKLIVACGDVGARCFTDNSNARISSYRREIVYYEGIPVIFINSMSEVLKDRGILNNLEKDFKKIKEIWNNGDVKVKKKKKRGYKILPWEDLGKNHSIALTSMDIETNGLDPYASGSRIRSIAATDGPQKVYYTQCDVAPGSSSLRALVKPLMRCQAVVCHNTTFDMGWLTTGLPLDHPLYDMVWEDTLITFQFLNERYPNTQLGHLSWIYAGIKKFKTPSFVKNGFPRSWDTPSNRRILKLYNCRDAVCCLRLRSAFAKEVNVESPIYKWVNESLKLAVRMRHSGIHLDQKQLTKLNIEFGREAKRLEKKLLPTGIFKWKEKDKAYTVNQVALRKHLYEKLKYPKIKVTPSGTPSVDAETLDKLQELRKTKFIKNLLGYRRSLKMRNTYCVNLIKWGRIAHPQVYISRSESRSGSDKKGTNTGRPTVEGFINLPARNNVIQKCLTSRYGKKGQMVVWDYSQMEMRVVADLSKDELMLQFFEDDQDLHTMTAALVLGIEAEDVTKEQRQNAKAVNFGIIYGQSAGGLAGETGMTKYQAQKFLDKYFAKFRGVANWIQSQHTEAMQSKIIHSIIGRPFHLPNATNEWSKDVRKSTNSPIQSPSSDFHVEALKQVQNSMIRNKWNAHLELSVYDSGEMDWLIEDWRKVPQDWLDEVLITRPKKAMKKLGWDIEVPIKYDIGIGSSWGDIKK